MRLYLETLLKNKINVGPQIPLRKWSKDWQLPDKCIIEKYTSMVNIGNRKLKVERLRLLGRMSKVKNHDTKKWYKGSSTYGLDYVVDDDYIWCILKSCLPLKLEITSSQLSTDENWLYFTVPENFTGVWYKYGTGRINFFIIPKELELNDEFWEVFGILQGEMTQKSRDLKISNTEPLILNLLLNFFDKNKLVLKDDWTITVSINSRNIPYEEKVKLSEKIKSYWSVKLNTLPEKIRNIFWYGQFNSTLNPNYGEINLGFENTSLRKVINIFLDFVKSEVLKSKEFAIPFLRGLFAAEGNVSSEKKKRLLELRLSAIKLEDRVFYQKVCEVAGLKASYEINHHNVRIYGLTNFLKCLEMGISNLHRKRKTDFIMKLKNFLTVQSLYFIRKKPQTVKKLVNLMKLSDYRNLNKNLSKLTQDGILFRKKIEEGYIYFPSQKLELLLNLLDSTNLSFCHCYRN